MRLIAHELVHVEQQTAASEGSVPRLQFERSGKASLLIPTERIDAVWGGFVVQQAGRMGLSKDDPRVRAAAAELTARQVGPTNFARWEAEGHSNHITLETEAQVRAEQAIEEASRQPMQLPNGESWSPSALRAYWVDETKHMHDGTLQLQQYVADMERQALKLKTPEGFQGKVYQYAGGGVGLVVSPTLGTTSKLLSLPVQTLIARVAGRPDPEATVGSIARGGKADAVTAYQLTSGELDEIYQETRKHYGSYIQTVSALTDARKALRNAQGLEDANAAYNQARAARAAMVEAFGAYVLACELAGIPSQAHKLESMFENTAEGLVFALETAATAPIGAFAPSRAGRKLLKEGEKIVAEFGESGLKAGARKTTTPGSSAVGAVDEISGVAPEVAKSASPDAAQAARTLAKELSDEGEPVVANLGGAGAKHEPKSAININNQAVSRKNIPKHVNADGTDIGDLFDPDTLTGIEGHNMPPGVIDWGKAAPGAYKVLKPGGTVRYYFRGANSDAEAMGAELTKAGFIDVKVVGRVLVTARKPGG